MGENFDHNEEIFLKLGILILLKKETEACKSLVLFEKLQNYKQTNNKYLYNLAV